MKRDREAKKKTLRIIFELYYPEIKDSSMPHNDWMGYPIDKENRPTYHHIVKASKKMADDNNDLFPIDNGAYLGEYSHDALHAIERCNYELYCKWNELFKRIIREGQCSSNEIKAEILILQEESIAALDKPTDKKKKKKKNKV